MEVVINAAGLGSRLNMGFPKALIEVAGKPILEHQVTALRAAFGNDLRIHVVGGYQWEALEAYCRYYLCVHAIRNPFYMKTGVVASAFMALPHLVDHEILRLDGDVLITDLEDLKSLVGDKSSTRFAVQKCTRRNQPVIHCKGASILEIEVVDESAGLLEWTCIEYYRGYEFQKVVNCCSEIDSWPWYMAVNDYIRQQEYARHTLPFDWYEVEGMLEIDTQEDLAHADTAIRNCKSILA